MPEDPDKVTMSYLHQQLSRFSDRLGRLEKFVVALGVATAMPKVGGPDPSELVSGMLSILH